MFFFFNNGSVPFQLLPWHLTLLLKCKHLNLLQKYSCLRHVPAYPQLINEKFDRCLDLYLCPRKMKMKLNMNPDDLIPKLPKPRDLKPFPTTKSVKFSDHQVSVSRTVVSLYSIFSRRLVKAAQSRSNLPDSTIVVCIQYPNCPLSGPRVCHGHVQVWRVCGVRRRRQGVEGVREQYREVSLESCST